MTDSDGLTMPIEPDPNLVISWDTLHDWLLTQVEENEGLDRSTGIGRALDALEAACLNEREIETGCAAILLSQLRSAGQVDQALRYLIQCAIDLDVKAQVLP